MARLARLKATESGAFYHLYSRTGGLRGEYPLDSKLCRRTIIEYIQFFSRVYCCKIWGFCVMGNHYHLLLEMDEPVSLSRKEVRARAKLLYNDTILDAWFEKDWARFEERIFDVSEFMRSLQSSIARWFNRTFSRRGRFWGDRFKSTLLEDRRAVLDCLYYIDLNPVRAGIVERPEEYDGSSIYYRTIRKDKWMRPLTEVMNIETRRSAIIDYKARLYFRGNVPSKPGQAKISNRIVEEEAELGFKERGVYRERIRFFVDGVVVGSQSYIKQHLEKLREQGQYQRRKNPIKQLCGIHMSLRAQRGE